MEVSKPTAKNGINWNAPQSTTGDIEQIAKSTMEIWQPLIAWTQEEKDKYETELAESLAQQAIEKQALDSKLATNKMKSELEIDKMQYDIKALSIELEALRYEVNLSTLSFLIVSLAVCIALILKFTGVI